ncbi:MAG: ABC transporter permease [Lachnospiraceae bacterium]|nr:ABC transporter permease [Lachnospiraceae bacterium]
MLNVNNKKAITNLAISGIKTNHKKYSVLIMAVILTTLLFSTLFTVGGSMIKEIQISTMRQVGGSAHAGFKYLTEAEYNQIKDDKELKEISYRVNVGVASDECLIKTPTEICYYEPLEAKFSFSYPEEGRMPKKENEIVLSDISLRALNVPKKIGQKFQMTLNIADVDKTYDFVLSGYFKGDAVSMAQVGMVSKAFQEKYAPVKQELYSKSNGSDLTGYISADFNFSNSYNIEKKVIKLINRTGLDENTQYGINWAYGTSSIDAETLAIIICLLLIFFLAGYLIIYNIFYINIISDMQEYGLLKTIGTTGKQLKKIVLKRANLISLIGIPIGLLLGIGVGRFLLPVISDQISTSSVGKGELHLNLLILLAAVLFSYLTVVISAIKPCKKASRVSPIEALRFSEERGKDGKPKKKMLVVILSISLGLVILNTVFAFISGFSMDSYIKDLIVSDFSIQDASLDNTAADHNETAGVDKAFVKSLSEQNFSMERGNVYLAEMAIHEMSDENWAKIKNEVMSKDSVKETITYYNSHEEGFDLDSYMKNLDERKSLQGNDYGMGRLAVEKLNVVDTINGDKEIDWNEFNSGKYILMDRSSQENGDKISILSPGDKVEVKSNNPKYLEYEEYTLENGETFSVPSNKNAPSKEYTIYAIVDIPYAMRLQCFMSLQCDYILPEDEFLKINGDWDPMRMLIDVEDKDEAKLNEWLKNYTTNIDPSLEANSKETVYDEYKSFSDMISLVGTIISIVLGLIGLLNFANTIATSIIVRSREFAVLEAVGMTGKQLRLSLMKEGGVYFIWTFIVSLIFSVLINVTLLRYLVNGIVMFEWNFTLLPLFICLPFIGILIVLIPVIAYMTLSKKTVVERLRVE